MNRPAQWMLSASLLLGGLVAVPRATPAQEMPCGGPEHRQFDFWVGSWRVTDAAGEPAGSNRIEPILGGCVLKESWVGESGVRGESFSLYSVADGTWHQTWVDSNGTLLLLDGGLEGGRMVLRGTTLGSEGARVRHEIAWEVLPDGRVKQHWRTSSDGGATWKDAFVGFYERRG